MIDLGKRIVVVVDEARLLAADQTRLEPNADAPNVGLKTTAGDVDASRMHPQLSSLRRPAGKVARLPKRGRPSFALWRQSPRAVSALGVVLLAGAVLASTASAAPASAAPHSATTTTTTTSPKAPTVALPATWQKGANLASWWYNEWEQTSTDASLSALRATNSTHAAFVTTWYMSSRTSSVVAPLSQKTPTDAGLLRAMAKARSLGMRPVLKLHVDVADGSWRGTIAPASPAAWFASYTTMANRYASLAQQAGAEMLVVGTELSTMSGYEQDWRRIIASTRTRFAGKLTFAANWIEGARVVNFWDALDYIGIDAYMPLASSTNPNPTVDQIVAAWRDRGYVSEIAAVQARWAKPVLFTELGYQSRVGTAVTPWYTPTGLTSQEPQRRAYEAAYRVWAPLTWLQGIYWWDWAPGTYSASDGEFNPRGKAAAATMTAWNSSTTTSST